MVLCYRITDWQLADPAGNVSSIDVTTTCATPESTVHALIPLACPGAAVSGHTTADSSFGGPTV